MHGPSAIARQDAKVAYAIGNPHPSAAAMLEDSRHAASKATLRIHGRSATGVSDAIVLAV